MSNWTRLLKYKRPGTWPGLPNYSKISWKLLSLLILSNWPILVNLWVVFPKMYSKTHPVSCTNTLHDIPDFINYGIIQNTKTWISWEQNIIFLSNEKKCNLCLGLLIMRFFHFVTKVTFNSWSQMLRYILV